VICEFCYYLQKTVWQRDSEWCIECSSWVEILSGLICTLKSKTPKNVFQKNLGFFGPGPVISMMIDNANDYVCMCLTVQMQLYTQWYRTHGDEHPTSDSPATDGCSHADDFKFDLCRFFMAAAYAWINSRLSTTERHGQSVAKSHRHVLRFRFRLDSGPRWPLSGSDHHRQTVLNVRYVQMSYVMPNF